MKTEFKPLSKIQKAQLSILARKAYEIESEYGNTDLSYDDWRHDQQTQAVGCSSLRQCVQRDYLKLRAHFQLLTGQDDKAFLTYLKDQPATDHADPTDTLEARQQVIKAIEQALDGSKYTLGYICTIANKQYHTTLLKNLTKKQLTTLLITAKSRVAKSFK